MKTFKTSGGYTFKLWEPREKVRVIEAGLIIKKGDIVEVLSHPEAISRNVMVISQTTGKKEEMNICQLSEIPGIKYKVKPISTCEESDNGSEDNI